METNMRMNTLVAALSIAVLAACAKDDTTAYDSLGTTDTAAAAAATATTPALTDANIAALLDEANAADSAAGKIASTKGTNAPAGSTTLRRRQRTSASAPIQCESASDTVGR